VTSWFPDPYVEGNFIWMTEAEKNQLARADQTFLVKTVQYVFKDGQFGANTDMELPMFNLVTRFVFAVQRSDRILVNDWDNYTNWESPTRAPWTAIDTNVMSSIYESGQQQITSVYPKFPVLDGLVLLDGKERFQTKTFPFFNLLQMYRHTTGITTELPGVYQYSFALDNDQYQPSGSLNGSMFNKIVLRLSLQQPIPASTSTSQTEVVYALKSTLFSQNPTLITAAQCALINPVTGLRVYPENDVVSIVQTNDNVIFTFTYNVGVYVESMNFLRIVSGLANLVFSS
jgi:hypothetical protein